MPTPTLVNITSETPNAVQIWGFHGSMTGKDVVEAVKTIATGLSGDGQEIHIMSGTHGYCNGRVGAVAKPDQRFTQEDVEKSMNLSLTTPDSKDVALLVHDFHTGDFASDPDFNPKDGGVTVAMTKLNNDMRTIVSSKPGRKVKFLLAYCCSAELPKKQSDRSSCKVRSYYSLDAPYCFLEISECRLTTICTAIGESAIEILQKSGDVC